MRAHWVSVENFPTPVDRVFAYLSEHKDLAAVYGAKVGELV